MTTEDQVLEIPTGEAFGSWLKVERHRRGLTQTQMGSLLGFSSQAINAWERGSTAPRWPSMRQKIKMALNGASPVNPEKALAISVTPGLRLDGEWGNLYLRVRGPQDLEAASVFLAAVTRQEHEA